MHKRLVGHAAVVAALASGLVVLPAAADPAAPAGKAEPPRTVTLITGDKVTVTRQNGSWDARIEPAKRVGERVSFVKSVSANGVTVIPSTVIPQVRSGMLDRALFDVTKLIELGYDDAHTSEIPLLVESQAARTLGRVTRELPRVRMSAVAASKSHAREQLVRTDAKIWLNGKAFPTLDVSVPQVGAPSAWQAGHTGAGARIAVLDTGYDTRHPDLAGIVKGEKDFTGEGIKDTVGHGTHVASTVAGRGGKYTGVAKGADLVIGKVCTAGGCPFDALLEGMQWAADSGAKVVNMSLGAGASDGTGPLDTAINRISAEKGTLFVVAAGNYGPNTHVASPAAADAALAVASVNKQDKYSTFSQPGPRIRDNALKPDMAAPGEDIVAARAEGTLANEAVDEHYAKLTGTSMATPHVAGAAAILAAQHPGWTGQQLKAALMASAKPVDATVFQQGAGRLDVGRAVKQTLVPSVGSLSLGTVRFPHTQPVDGKQITYRNTGSTPVTLRLSTDVTAFKLSASEITVPANGEAGVTVTFDHASVPVGVHSGRLTATGGETVVQTPVGAYKEPESYDLTAKFIDRDGAEPQGVQSYAIWIRLDTDDDAFDILVNNQTARLPKGRYAVAGSIQTPIPGQLTPSITSAAEPTVDLTKDTAVTLDARKGKKVAVHTEEKDARMVSGTTGMAVATGGRGVGYYSQKTEDDYVVPGTGNHPHFTYFDRIKMERPAVRLTVDKPESFEVAAEWVPDSPTTTDTRALTAVDVGHATPAEIASRDLKGKLAVFTLNDVEGVEYNARVQALADAGANSALFHFSGGRIRIMGPTPIPVAVTLRPEGTRLAKLGTAAVTLTGNPPSPYHYELAYPSHGSMPTTVDYQARARDLTTVRTTYRANSSGQTGYVDMQATDRSTPLEASIDTAQIPLPLERTEYYSPMSWLNGFVAYAPGGEPIEYLGTRTFKPGEKTTADWGKSVVGPGITGPDSRFQPSRLVTRTGDTITANLPLFSDSAGHSGFSWSNFGDTGDTVLSAGGKEISRSGKPGGGQYTVPAGAAQYRLATQVQRNHAVWPLSTSVSAEWTFQSGHTAAETPLPLLTVAFDPKVDLTNYAPAGALAAVPVRVDRQSGTQGGKAEPRKVEVSYDDGQSWRQVPLLRANDQWWAMIQNPKSGFVSLRANASDSDGNAVAQTVIRAYRVK
nr:S8 family serine peptidase [Kibdelosporangium sp. MJ126-NF4]CEL21953.1 peptidase S8 and S53, subtilisin, kexin, sedolisin [Kibdelosporangium sp. MJ126-NF4]CTQ92733.1 peptidase S8 and S53, subtilisin, kexin, sedolisin [Kibdelosporangium sp. MJ126-NF4]